MGLQAKILAASALKTWEREREAIKLGNDFTFDLNNYENVIEILAEIRGKET